MGQTPAVPEKDLLAALERTVEMADGPQLVTLLGGLERLKGVIWQRLVATATALVGLPPTDPVEEPRHLTPQEVAGILSLKAAYVHELCRTGRVPAVKSGKYWMIPVAGLRRWLAYQNRDIDGSPASRVESRNPSGDPPRVDPVGLAGRARRPPMA